jgi:hypothetical protein
MSENTTLFSEIEKLLMFKAPLIEFDATSNEQIIMCPSFQHRILDVLIDLMPTHTKLVKDILENNEKLISFTESFVHFYRNKTLNGNF